MHAVQQKKSGHVSCRKPGLKHRLIILLGLLLLLFSVSGCNQSSQPKGGENASEPPAVTEAPAQGPSEMKPPVEVPVSQQQSQEGITVNLEHLQLLSQVDFGDGRHSDAVKLTVTVEQESDISLRVYPDGGRLLLNTGEEISTAKGEFHETYADGTLKKGDLYFPLTLTRPEEINHVRFVMEGPANQYFTVVGEDFVFKVPVNHPDHQPVERQELIERAYAHAEKLTAAPGVTESRRMALVENLGEITLHVIDVVLYEAMEHPFAAFLKVDEPVNFIALTLAIENTGDNEVTFSSARSRLRLNGGEALAADHLMSQYLSPDYAPGGIKTGAVFYLIPEALPAELETLELLTELVLPGENPEPVTLQLPIR
ncbi:hypothetical protein [Anoxynatronum buryatiense]|uniref:DUF4352 domain-containing protein n=1 Tax=Anoxynatronum buryatiense TaxID=489973 RepID=A0AA45WXK5_9CLOT|nr:hypothetical protein [Anoxynatronum buryatiense]SMP59943.1 hypothetical protein SAMN06296020_10821 [Anoxynatronum buryatiense]